MRDIPGMNARAKSVATIISPGYLARHDRGLGHNVRFMAEYLRGAGVLVLRDIEQRFCLFVLIYQRFGAYHLGSCERRAESAADAAEGKVRHSRHRRESQVPAQLDIAYLHHDMSSPPGQ